MSGADGNSRHWEPPSRFLTPLRAPHSMENLTSFLKSQPSTQYPPPQRDPFHSASNTSTMPQLPPASQLFDKLPPFPSRQYPAAGPSNSHPSLSYNGPQISRSSWPMSNGQPERRSSSAVRLSPAEQQPLPQLGHKDHEDGILPPSSSDFVKKLFRMLEDQSYADIVCWGPQGDSFVVKDMTEFTKLVLPRMFKHSNFASFVRQLNKVKLVSCCRYWMAADLLCLVRLPQGQHFCTFGPTSCSLTIVQVKNSEDSGYGDQVLDPLFITF